MAFAVWYHNTMTHRHEASGKFLLRVGPDLHGRLRRLAAERRTSLNALCAQWLREAAAPDVPPHAQGPSGQPAWLTAARDLVEGWGEELLGVALFGSAARGELRASSDIDLLLVLDASVPLQRQLYRRWDELVAAKGLERELNAHFVHLPRRAEDAGSLWLEVAVEGRVISDRRGCLEGALMMLRRAIANGQFVRQVAHGQPFWRRAA